MRYLALILFLPWFAIIGFAYWHLPRNLPRPPSRRGFDWGAIGVATLVATLGALVALDMDWQHTGKIWPQVAAVLFAYGSFLLLMLIAMLLRARIWGGRRL
jgi:hypothetical protein